MFTFTPAAKTLLKQLEGCKLVAYQDGGGVWTCGWGHTQGVTQSTVFTQEDADLALDRDLARFTQGVRLLLGTAPPLTDGQFSALVIFAFNVGLAAFAGSTVLKKIQIGRFDQVPEQLMRWTKIHAPSGGFIDDPGLVRRRQAEVALWNSGKPVA